MVSTTCARQWRCFRQWRCVCLQGAKETGASAPDRSEEGCQRTHEAWHQEDLAHRGHGYLTVRLLYIAAGARLLVGVLEEYNVCTLNPISGKVSNIILNSQ